MEKKEREKERAKALKYMEFVSDYLSKHENQQMKETVSEMKTQIVDENDIASNNQEIQIPVKISMDVKTEILLEDAPAQIGASSVIGKRASQQDSIIFPSEKNMFVEGISHFVCALSDGMGGLSGGEKASKIAANVIFEDFYRVYKNNVKNLSYQDFFDYESDKINEYILSLTDSQGNPIRSGATLISTIIDNKNLYYLNIGDSRIYLLRNNSLLQLTKDQNYYSKLLLKVHEGEITLEQANSHPKKEALISYCGIDDLTLKEINVKPVTLETNDVIMLCSDGLYRIMSNAEIISIINDSFGDMNLAAYRLTAAATNKNYRGQDNTSVILIKIN